MRDPFGRWRVSSPQSLFDTKFVNDTGSIFWTSKFVGNSTASWNRNSASIVLTVGAASGSQVVRQTRRRFNYQPGKGQLIVCSATFGNGVPGIIKRVGYFDVSNGLYFAQSGSSFGVGVRSTSETPTPYDTFISQSNWNIDKMDGSGPSGIRLDLTKSQIFSVDFEWLGAGRVRFGVYNNGQEHHIHQIDNANVRPGVYMSTPNLPIRYAITSFGAASDASLTQICSTVISEGGQHHTGYATSVNTGIIPISCAASASVVLLAIRKNVNYKSLFVIPHAIGLATPGTSDGLWTVSVNPTFSTPLMWQPLGITGLEYATGSGGNAIVSKGYLVNSGYLVGSKPSSPTSFGAESIDFFQGLGFDADDNPDVLVLAFQSIGGTNTLYSSMDLQVEQ